MRAIAQASCPRSDAEGPRAEKDGVARARAAACCIEIHARRWQRHRLDCATCRFSDDAHKLEPERLGNNEGRALHRPISRLRQGRARLCGRLRQSGQSERLALAGTSYFGTLRVILAHFFGTLPCCDVMHDRKKCVVLRI